MATAQRSRPRRRLRDRAGGGAPRCDPKLLGGVLFGKLGAEPEPIAFYEELTEDGAFRHPLAWGGIEPAEFDGLLLPGGHAQGMRQYLGDAKLQLMVAPSGA